MLVALVRAKDEGVQVRLGLGLGDEDVQVRGLLGSASVLGLEAYAREGQGWVGPTLGLGRVVTKDMHRVSTVSYSGFFQMTASLPAFIV